MNTRMREEVQSTLDALLEHDRQTHRQIEACYEILKVTAPEENGKRRDRPPKPQGLVDTRTAGSDVSGGSFEPIEKLKRGRVGPGQFIEALRRWQEDHAGSVDVADAAKALGRTYKQTYQCLRHANAQRIGAGLYKIG